ncbi:MAG: PIG-L deacetylase family protein [Bacteroidota bacterium]
MKLLVVSPHPDDETLGAGGTILKHKQMRDQVYWLNFTDLKEEYGCPRESVTNRKAEIESVKKAYGFDGFLNLELKPTGLDEYSTGFLVDRVSRFVHEVQPNIVILPFRNDAHSDHRVVFESVYSCTKVFRYSSINRILMMEILSETDFAPSDNGFIPNYFVDISDFLAEKINILKIYQSEIKDHPFPRSEENVKALATLRGATAGKTYAESFFLIKEIE